MSHRPQNNRLSQKSVITKAQPSGKKTANRFLRIGVLWVTSLWLFHVTANLGKYFALETIKHDVGSIFAFFGVSASVATEWVYAFFLLMLFKLLFFIFRHSYHWFIAKDRGPSMSMELVRTASNDPNHPLYDKMQAYLLHLKYYADHSKMSIEEAHQYRGASEEELKEISFSVHHNADATPLASFVALGVKLTVLTGMVWGLGKVAQYTQLSLLGILYI